MSLLVRFELRAGSGRRPLAGTKAASKDSDGYRLYIILLLSLVRLTPKSAESQVCSGKGFPSALVSAEHSSSAGLAEAAWVLSSEHSGRMGSDQGPSALMR